MFTGSRYLGLPVFIDRALCNCTDSRTEIAAIAQRLQLYADHRAGCKAARRDSLLRDCGGAGHFDAPGYGLSVRSAHRLTIRTEWNKVQLRVIGLGHKPGGDAGPR